MSCIFASLAYVLLFFYILFFLLLSPLLAHAMSVDDNQIVDLPQPDNAVPALHSNVPFRIDLPAPFSGDNAEPFGSWIQRFEVALNVSATPPDKATLLPAKLTGPAFAYWQSLSPAIKANYELTKTSLSAVFGRATFLATFQTYLNARPRKPQEPLEVYAAELTSLVTEAFPQYDVTARNCEIFRRFVTGLDPALQLKIHEHGAVTLNDALKIASQCERANLAISVANPTTIMPVTVHQQPSPATTISTPIADLASAIADLRLDLHTLRQSHQRRTDERLDLLSQQITNLQHKGTETTYACAAVDYNTTPRSRPPEWDGHHHHRQDCCCQSQHLQRPRQQPYDDYSASQRHRSTYNCAASYEDPRQQSRRSYPPPPLCCESHTPYHTHFDRHSSYRRNYTLSEPDRSPSRERRPHFGYEDRPYATRSPSPNPHSSYRTHSSPSPPPHHRQSSRSHTSPTRHVRFSPVKRDMAPPSPRQGNE